MEKVPENSFRTKFGGEYSWSCREKVEKQLMLLKIFKEVVGYLN